MTATRLTSTTERYTIAATHAPISAEAYRVESAESLSGDRKRSLREELEAAQSAIGSRESEDLSEIQEEVRRIAALIAELSPADEARLFSPGDFSVVDEAA
ncbi:MAG: hypothetical protein LBV49_08595 [Azonexus sp.]|jgi:hypothetical protein|nr:hypothetical protein [Azonexus sp.]